MSLLSILDSITDLSASQFRLFFHLVRLAQELEDGLICKSVKEIARSCRCSEQKARKLLHSFIELGLLEPVEWQLGRKITYWLTPAFCDKASIPHFPRPLEPNYCLSPGFLNIAQNSDRSLRNNRIPVGPWLSKMGEFDEIFLNFAESILCANLNKNSYNYSIDGFCTNRQEVIDKLSQDFFLVVQIYQLFTQSSEYTKGLKYG